MALLLPRKNPTTNPTDRRTIPFRERFKAPTQGRGVGAAGRSGSRSDHRQAQAFSETFHGPPRAADQRLRDLIDQQAPSRSDGVGVTFGQLLDQWLEECDRVDLSPTTLRTYRSQIERTIRPSLGKVTLTRLTAKNLDSLYGAMKDAGKSPKTIRNHQRSSRPHFTRQSDGDGSLQRRRDGETSAGLQKQVVRAILGCGSRGH